MAGSSWILTNRSKVCWFAPNSHSEVWRWKLQFNHESGAQESGGRSRCHAGSGDKSGSCQLLHPWVANHLFIQKRGIHQSKKHLLCTNIWILDMFLYWHMQTFHHTQASHLAQKSESPTFANIYQPQNWFGTRWNHQKTGVDFWPLSCQGFQPGEVRLRSLASAVQFYERLGYERLEVWIGVEVEW